MKREESKTFKRLVDLQKRLKVPGTLTVGGSGRNVYSLGGKVIGESAPQARAKLHSIASGK